eukprot:TRINITY_DN19724_c0_g1_i2.p1 TRINITY_DN19724_c0_g1~~TRINITY_DN19724_c0_g1_i2.p1  ORF type:complete len:105 (-),score=18.86 TRINITY_DN19724_c0_g1_i2:235-549(-)
MYFTSSAEFLSIHLEVINNFLRLHGKAPQFQNRSRGCPLKVWKFHVDINSPVCAFESLEVLEFRSVCNSRCSFFLGSWRVFIVRLLQNLVSDACSCELPGGFLL